MDGAFLLHQLRQFVFTLASHGDTVFLGTLAILGFGFGPIGRALAARIRGSTTSPAAEGQLVLSDIRTELAEVHERLEFSERMLLEMRQHVIAVGREPASERQL